MSGEDAAATTDLVLIGQSLHVNAPLPNVNATVPQSLQVVEAGLDAFLPPSHDGQKAAPETSLAVPGAHALHFFCAGRSV
jgi:hypothetical protein